MDEILNLLRRHSKECRKLGQALAVETYVPALTIARQQIAESKTTLVTVLTALERKQGAPLLWDGDQV